MLAWVYTAVIRPIRTYGAIVWCTGLMPNSNVSSISRVQRQACLAVIGALRTTSNESLNTILGLLPVEDCVMEYAALAAVRLKCLGSWVTKSYGHMTILIRFHFNENIKYNNISSIYNFDQRYKAEFPSRED